MNSYRYPEKLLILQGTYVGADIILEGMIAVAVGSAELEATVLHRAAFMVTKVLDTPVRMRSTTCFMIPMSYRCGGFRVHGAC